MRTTGIGSEVTETEHVQVPATSSHGRQTRRVVSPLIAIECVEEPAIEHRLEHSAEKVQVQGIGNHELSVDAATRRLLPRDRQCGLRHIDSENVQPQGGNMEGVLARPASRIENRAGECAFARQAQYRGLWFSDVPRRRTIEVRRIPRPALPPLVTGWLPRARGVGRLGEGDRVPVRIGDVHVADTVRVGLDRFVLDALSGEALEERVESLHGEGDPASARLQRVRVDEEPGVLVDLPEDLLAGATVWRSSEEPRVPIDAGVEIGYRDAGEEVGDRALAAQEDGTTTFLTSAM
jgi:hypothetical protein